MTVKMTELEFEEKYQIYSQTIFNIAYGYTKNVQDSEDIVQNVFVKLILNQKVFKDEFEEFLNLNTKKYQIPKFNFPSI